jgi:hypothetical protein
VTRLAEIDTEALLELVWVAPLAALVVMTSFSVVIHGVARSNDSRRAGRTGAATAYGVLAVVAAIAFGAAVIFGVAIITSKD